MYINFVMRLNNKMGLKYKISALILDRQYQRMYQHLYIYNANFSKNHMSSIQASIFRPRALSKGGAKSC